jgi:CelD/BcsL family acetyltransferase involved in cellulose biosynthesis
MASVRDAVLATPGWSWATLSLDPRQGWSDEFAVGAETFVVPRVGRTYVLSELPASPDQLVSGLKRNVRESMRRSLNRLGRLAEPWSVERTRPGDEGFPAAMNSLVSLHGRRAAMSGRRRHGDIFSDRRYVHLLGQATGGEGCSGLLSLFSLRVGDRVVATQLVAHSPTASLLVASGIDQEGWDLSPMAVLIKEIMSTDIAEGRSTLNHSGGPSTGKLRWSENMVTHHEFSVIRRTRSARLAFSAYSHAGLWAAVHRETNRHWAPA